MKKRTNRRTFLRHSSLASLGCLILPDSRSVWGAPANDKLNIALIGVSGRGSWFVSAIPQMNTNVIAMCDVNDKRSAEAFERIPKAKKFHDFRVMLDKMEKEIDGVIIATPDHTHAVASTTALHSGIPVYCEKPLTHNIAEARRLRELSQQYNLVTQMGNQGTASEAFRRATELIQHGVIGEVREVHAWNTGGGPGDRPIPEEKQPIPDHLAWDLWLGPASERPFHSRWLNWHGWRDFGTGQLGNWACHTMNVIFKSLKVNTLWTPTTASQKSRRYIKVKAKVSGIHHQSFPRWEIIDFDIPKRENLPPFTLHWYNGPGQAPGPRKKIEELLGRRLDWGDAGEKKWRDHAGCLIIGSQGMLHSNGHNTEYTLLPKDKFEGFNGPPKTLPRSRGHEQEWLSAIKGETQTMSAFHYSAPLTEFVLLGNVATQFNDPIEFDPTTMKITNLSKANEYLSREYRGGWSL